MGWFFIIINYESFPTFSTSLHNEFLLDRVSSRWSNAGLYEKGKKAGKAHRGSGWGPWMVPASWKHILICHCYRCFGNIITLLSQWVTWIYLDLLKTNSLFPWIRQNWDDLQQETHWREMIWPAVSKKKRGYEQEVTYPKWETHGDTIWCTMGRPRSAPPRPRSSRRVQGCFKWTDSSTYFGDFKDNEIAGYGMYLGSCLGIHKTSQDSQWWFCYLFVSYVSYLSHCICVLWMISVFIIAIFSMLL